MLFNMRKSLISKNSIIRNQAETTKSNLIYMYKVVN